MYAQGVSLVKYVASVDTPLTLMFPISHFGQAK
jgi:hypothetical protein